jgi:hypothetical protein
VQPQVFGNLFFHRWAFVRVGEGWPILGSNTLVVLNRRYDI